MLLLQLCIPLYSAHFSNLLIVRHHQSSSETTTWVLLLSMKKQASFFLTDKIRTARLALTDVTPAELCLQIDRRSYKWKSKRAGSRYKDLGLISRAAFEVDDYWRIVEILHKWLQRFDRNNWRVSYKALILLEHLLTHGPESVAEEFQSDMDVVKEMESFQYMDEKGFNCGLNVRKKSERILKLLEKGPLLKEERDRARKLTRRIQGFGSFSQRSSTTEGSFKESSFAAFGRCNSDFINHDELNNQLFSEGGVTTMGTTTTATTTTTKSPRHRIMRICKSIVPDNKPTKDDANPWNGFQRRPSKQEIWIPRKFERKHDPKKGIGCS